jgi:hypothetical protein
MLLIQNPRLLLFPDSWQTLCKRYMRDPGHHTHEGSCREAQGADPDDHITRTIELNQIQTGGMS